MKTRVLALTGPTASGKSALSLPLARELNGEIICMDSMQMYKGMDIGTAKPDQKERTEVPHHLLDLVEPGVPYSAAEYKEAALSAIRDIVSRGKLPILCGGTGLYLRALTGGLDFGGAPADEGIRARYQTIADTQGNEAVHQILADKDPQSAQVLHPNNLRRVIRALEVLEVTGLPFSARAPKEKPDSPYAFKMYALKWQRETLYERIGQRVDRMMEEGLLDEVRALIDKGVPPDAQSMQGLGYKELVPCLSGQASLNDATELIKRRTRNYAKRQITWFKAEQGLVWLPGENGKDSNIKTILKEMSGA